MAMTDLINISESAVSVSEISDPFRRSLRTGPDPTNFWESNMEPAQYCVGSINSLQLGPYHLFNLGGTPGDRCHLWMLQPSQQCRIISMCELDCSSVSCYTIIYTIKPYSSTFQVCKCLDPYISIYMYTSLMYAL